MNILHNRLSAVMHVGSRFVYWGPDNGAEKLQKAREMLEAMQDENNLPVEETSTNVSNGVKDVIPEKTYVWNPTEEDLNGPPEGGDPEPQNEAERKVYNYFWNKKQWTYASMNALSLDEIKEHLKRAGINIEDKDELKKAFYFFKRLKPAKYDMETAKILEASLTSQ